MNKVKKLPLNLIVLVVTAVLCFIFMEMLFRLLIFSNLYAYSIEGLSGYKESHLPGFYYTEPPSVNLSLDFMQFSTNSLGFRTNEYNPKTESVIVLGDSVTFGYGVNDSQVYPWLNS